MFVLARITDFFSPFDNAHECLGLNLFGASCSVSSNTETISGELRFNFGLCLN